MAQLASTDPSTLQPHVRSHIIRTFINAPNNDPALPVLVTTTDIRTPKVSQIVINPHVELAWWIDGTKEQYRLSGKGYIVPKPGGDLYQQFLSASAAADRTSGIWALRMEEGFDWETKRVEIFKSLSSHMRASWCRPVPGSKLEGGEDEAKKWPATVDEPGPDAPEEEKRNWETALGRFALIIVDPSFVDYVELGVVPNRRWKFWRTEGRWEEEAVVP